MSILSASKSANLIILSNNIFNGDFLNQKNPTSADLPLEIMKNVMYESNDAASVYGGHGCGEPPDICYAAIHNAFYNATGKRVKNTLMYPARVLQAMGTI